MALRQRSTGHPAAGLLRPGFVPEVLPKPIRYGYMNGIALAVLISQLPKLFGISIERHGPLRDVLKLGLAILAGKADWYSSAVGGGCLALILLQDSGRPISD